MKESVKLSRRQSFNEFLNFLNRKRSEFVENLDESHIDISKDKVKILVTFNSIEDEDQIEFELKWVVDE